MTSVSLNPNKAGLALGTLIGGWHLLWSLVVAAGWAQALINFILWLHFIKPIYVIDAFNVFTAALLVVVTAVVGYIFGYCFSIVWNWMHRS